MKTERVQQGIASTIHADLTADGVPLDPTPDAATITLTRLSDGTTLGPYDAFDEGTGEFSHTLSPTETADLDILTASWSMTLDGYTHVFETRVEIVGGFLFGLEEAKAIPGMTAQPVDAITTYRLLVETELEEACGRAFVPRYTQETLDGTGTGNLMLSKPEVRRIRSVTVDGTAYTSGQIAGLAMAPTGLVTDSAGTWAAGTTNVTVDYEYGPSFAPAGAKRVALILFKMWLGGVNRPIDDRAITFNTTEGGTYSLAVPGRNGSVFGHPDIDAFVQRNSLIVGVA